MKSIYSITFTNMPLDIEYRIVLKNASQTLVLEQSRAVNLKDKFEAYADFVMDTYPSERLGECFTARIDLQRRLYFYDVLSDGDNVEFTTEWKTINSI